MASRASTRRLPGIRARAGEPVRVSRNVVERVLREQSGLLVRDVEMDKSFSVVQTLTHLHIRPCYAFHDSIGEADGVIYLDS